MFKGPWAYAGMTLANTSWLKSMYVKALKDGSSVVAVSKEGKLMGVRVGNVTRYNNIVLH